MTSQPGQSTSERRLPQPAVAYQRAARDRRKAADEAMTHALNLYAQTRQLEEFYDQACEEQTPMQQLGVDPLEVDSIGNPL